MTQASCAVRIESLSTIRLARSSCTMPMTRLESTTPMKSMLRYWPVTMTSSASTRLTALKKVSVWSRTIWTTDLVLTSALVLTRPSATRSATSAEVSPTRDGGSCDTGCVWGTSMWHLRCRLRASARGGMFREPSLYAIRLRCRKGVAKAWQYRNFAMCATKTPRKALYCLSVSPLSSVDQSVRLRSERSQVRVL